MGGNVNITGPGGKSYRVDKPDFRRLNRSQFKTAFIDAFKKLDSLHSAKFGTPIWPKKTRDSLLSSGRAFNGSSEHLFGSSLTDEELTRYKPTFGDIDLTVPADKSETLFQLLDVIPGKKLNASVSYVDKKPSPGGEQINCLFAYTEGLERTLYVQVDFEFVDYAGGSPDEFAKFGHSSSWEDIRENIKGVFHKYMLRCLATIVSLQKDVVLLTKTSPLDPPEKIKVSKSTNPVRLLSFSVDKGLRTKFEQQFHDDGSPVMVNGMKAYKEIPGRDDVRSLSEIFALLFGDEPMGNEIASMGSFLGLLQLMQDHFDDAQIEDVYLEFIGNKLFGKEGQALDATSPEVDRSAKMAAAAAFQKKFPFLKKHDSMLTRLQDEYYKTYKVRAESLRFWGRLLRA